MPALSGSPTWGLGFPQTEHQAILGTSVQEFNSILTLSGDTIQIQIHRFRLLPMLLANWLLGGSNDLWLPMTLES